MRSIKRTNSKATLTLEAAMICPVVLLLIGGSIDVGQYINVAQISTNAAREGALMASRDETISFFAVASTVKQCYSDAMPGMTEEELGNAMSIQLLQHDGQPVPNNDLTTIDSGQPVRLLITFDFESVRWLGGITFWSMAPVTTHSVCRRE